MPASARARGPSGDGPASYGAGRPRTGRGAAGRRPAVITSGVIDPVAADRQGGSYRTPGGALRPASGPATAYDPDGG
ncbi:hypothetical protein GCM10010249_41550 [Streptomyces roseolilacinus]|uniref:Uncharacterized protein n=1 Tax=Streptomyces roseolilacinus TaxID=66904 RepID=A0A918B4R6_9ACTN|nr:hypothetical protein GCM10010249_41550 [Streptomyces roseolilacinus]